MKHRRGTATNGPWRRIAGLLITAVILGGIFPQNSRWSSPALATTLNRRFSQNPYVPPLVFGSAVETARATFKCPRALILGFRGSGEQPPEFMVTNAGILTESGQKYSNWNRNRGFVDNSGHYKQSNYLSSRDRNFYDRIFGETVGVHVLSTRKQVAKVNGWRFSDVGIWSVGVDDLEFSTETPPQSAYHAPRVSANIPAYLEQIRRSQSQLAGLPVPGISSDSQLSNLYLALFLFEIFCPKLEGLYLIGYSQGAVIARHLAASSRLKNLAASEKPPFRGPARRTLFLIGDPLFDGREESFSREMELQLIVERKKDDYEAFRRARGLLQRTDFCHPRFTVDVQCEIGKTTFNFTKLHKEFTVKTLCAKNDLICQPPLDAGTVISLVRPFPIVISALKIRSGINSHTSYKNAKPDVVFGRVCGGLGLCD